MKDGDVPPKVCGYPSKEIAINQWNADGKSRNTKKQRINGTSVNTVCIRNRVEEGGGENGTQDNDSFELPF